MVRRAAHTRVDARTGKAIRVREHEVAAPSKSSRRTGNQAGRLRDQAAAAVAADAATIPLDTHLPVFVYGTLRPGHWNYRGFLEGRTEAEAPATLPGGRMWDGGFPYVAETEGGGTIVGILIDVKRREWDGVRHRLDGLEGFDPAGGRENHYTRQARSVTAADGSTRIAWVYFAAPETVSRIEARGLPVIPSGDWAEDGAHNARRDVRAD